jgi:hypothetical protein
MHVQPHQGLLTKARGLRPVMGAAFVASLIAMLAAIPVGSAVASPSSEATVEVTTPISLPTTPTDVLNPLLATVPVKDLNVKDLDPQEISQMLGGLLDLKGNQLTSLVANLTPLLTTELTSKPDLTLGELTEGGLLGGVLTLLGLNSSKLTPNEVLAGLLSSVSKPAQASKITEQLLTQLGKSLQVKDPTEVKSLVEELLGDLNSSELATLESTLGVGSLTPAALTTKITELLGTGSSSQIEAVVHELLSGLTFESPSTLGGLAGKLGTSVETLATDLGTSVETLSGGLGVTAATALPTLIAPLENGKLLTILDGPEGLKITTLESKETSGKETAKEKEAKESKEAKEHSETGTPGSNGSSGSNGTPGTTSVVVNLPAAAAAATPGSTPAVAAKTVAKIKILSHKVKAHIATLVLQIPVAGKVTVSGGGVRAVGKGATKAERLTVRIPLSKAGTASLRKRHNRLSVTLKASFKPNSGSSSSASVTVHFA